MACNSVIIIKYYIKYAIWLQCESLRTNWCPPLEEKSQDSESGLVALVCPDTVPKAPLQDAGVEWALP